MIVPLHCYHVVHLVVKEGKPSDGEFTRQRLQHTVQEICLEKRDRFETVRSSRATMTRRFKDISSDVLINSER